MGVRVGVRISRGVWVTGGPGIASTVLALRLFELSAIAILMLVAGVMAIALSAALTIWQSRDTARRSLARQSLADGVDPGVVRVVGGRSDPPVWGVYLMGADVYTGTHPKRQNSLARLYPHKSDLLCAALMPDARRASAAARQLRRHGFSTSEVRRLFPPTLPAPSEDAPARILQPASPEQHVSTPVQYNVSRAPKGPTMTTSERDLTKYRFYGQVLGKGRLVWSVVKRYVDDHPGASLEELRLAFPDELQASSALQFSPLRVVVFRVSDIPHSETKRFFLSDGETIVVGDAEVAVSREWNRENIQTFLARANELGYAVSIAP